MISKNVLIFSAKIEQFNGDFVFKPIVLIISLSLFRLEIQKKVYILFTTISFNRFFLFRIFLEFW